MLDLRRRPGRQHLGDRQAVEPVPEEAQEAQRGLVRAVRVVDRQQQRAELLGQVHDEPIETLLAGEGSVITRTFALRGEHLAGQFGGAVPDRVAGRAQDRFEQLAHDAEGELLLELVAPCAQDGQLVHRAQQFAQEQGFPHPRLTHHEHRGALAAAHPVEHPAELVELAIALEQEPRRAGRDDGVDRGHPTTLFHGKRRR